MKIKTTWEVKDGVLHMYDEFNHWLDSEGLQYETFLQNILEEYGDLWLDETHSWKVSDELRWLEYLDSPIK